MIDKFIIVDLVDNDIFKSSDTGNVRYFDSEQDALDVCGIYEMENVHIAKLILSYSEIE